MRSKLMFGTLLSILFQFVHALEMCQYFRPNQGGCIQPRLRPFPDPSYGIQPNYTPQPNQAQQSQANDCKQTDSCDEKSKEKKSARKLLKYIRGIIKKEKKNHPSETPRTITVEEIKTVTITKGPTPREQQASTQPKEERGHYFCNSEAKDKPGCRDIISLLMTAIGNKTKEEKTSKNCESNSDKNCMNNNENNHKNEKYNKRDGERNKTDKNNEKSKDNITVTRIKEKVKTVEKPITLYREFTKTITKIKPITNYRVTTFTEEAPAVTKYKTITKYKEKQQGKSKAKNKGETSTQEGGINPIAKTKYENEIIRKCRVLERIGSAGLIKACKELVGFRVEQPKKIKPNDEPKAKPERETKTEEKIKTKTVEKTKTKTVEKIKTKTVEQITSTSLPKREITVTESKSIETSTETNGITTTKQAKTNEKNKTTTQHDKKTITVIKTVTTSIPYYTPYASKQTEEIPAKTIIKTVTVKRQDNKPKEVSEANEESRTIEESENDEEDFKIENEKRKRKNKAGMCNITRGSKQVRMKCRDKTNKEFYVKKNGKEVECHPKDVCSDPVVQKFLKKVSKRKEIVIKKYKQSKKGKKGKSNGIMKTVYI